MSKFYAVSIQYTAIIRADTPEEASTLANISAREIVRDSSAPEETQVLQEIRGQDQLSQFGWDGMCLPYGETDSNTRLNEYLPEITP